MKRKQLRFSLGATLVILLIGFLQTAQANQYQETINTYANSPEVRPYFSSAYGYAVFPLVGKGGFVIGATYGKGMVYRQGQLTGEAVLAKASIGAQLGGQAFSEIIFFENQAAYERFTTGQFVFEASASAVAIIAGAQAKIGTDGATASKSLSKDAAEQVSAGYRNGMAVFVHIKGGLMYEAAIGGQSFQFRPL